MFYTIFSDEGDTSSSSSDEKNKRKRSSLTKQFSVLPSSPNLSNGTAKTKRVKNFFSKLYKYQNKTNYIMIFLLLII